MSSEEAASRRAVFAKAPVIKEIAKCDNLYEAILSAGETVKAYKELNCITLKETNKPAFNEKCLALLKEIQSATAYKAEYEWLGCAGYKKKGWFKPLTLEGNNLHPSEVNINALTSIMKEVLGNAPNPTLQGVNFPLKAGSRKRKRKTRRSTKRRARRSTRKH